MTTTTTIPTAQRGRLARLRRRAVRRRHRHVPRALAARRPLRGRLPGRRPAGRRRGPRRAARSCSPASPRRRVDPRRERPLPRDRRPRRRVRRGAHDRRAARRLAATRTTSACASCSATAASRRSSSTTASAHEDLARRLGLTLRTMAITNTGDVFENPATRETGTDPHGRPRHRGATCGARRACAPAARSRSPIATRAAPSASRCVEGDADHAARRAGAHARPPASR